MAAPFDDSFWDELSSEQPDVLSTVSSPIRSESLLESPAPACALAPFADAPLKQEEISACSASDDSEPTSAATSGLFGVTAAAAAPGTDLESAAAALQSQIVQLSAEQAAVDARDAEQRVAAGSGRDDEPSATEALEEADKPRRRKRQRVELPQDAFVPVVDPLSTVALSRETLLHMSSENLEEYIRQLVAFRGHDLNENEKAVLQRQRRLIKNRESAAASRQRKKGLIQALEGQINEVRAELDDVKRENGRLLESNSRLHSEVARLRQIIAANNALQSLYEKGVNLFKVGSLQTSGKTASVALMIMIFSFGLFLGTHHAQSIGAAAPPTAAVSSTGRHLLAVDDDIGLADVPVVPNHIQPPLRFDDDDVVAAADAAAAADEHRAAAYRHHHHRQQQHQQQQHHQQQQQQQARQQPALRNSKMRELMALFPGSEDVFADIDTLPAAAAAASTANSVSIVDDNVPRRVPPARSSSSSIAIVNERAAPQRRTLEPLEQPILKGRPDTNVTNYWFLPYVQHVATSGLHTHQARSDAQPTLGLFIPRSAFTPNTSADSDERYHEDMVEVQCQVKHVQSAPAERLQRVSSIKV